MQRLDVLGFWFSPDAPSELPLPQRLVGGLGPGERAAVLAYLRAGTVLVTFPEPSFCRFACGEAAMGTRDLTDGRWVWPEGLAHYVERHDVRLPPPFLAHAVAANGVVAPFRAPKPRFGLYDRSAWLAWGRAERACLDLTGFELPDPDVRERIATDLGAVPYEHILLCNGATREVVLDVGGGALERRQVKPGAPPPRRFAGWHEWPAAGEGAAPSSSPASGVRAPSKPGRGVPMTDFFTALRDRQQRDETKH